jgi:hypothetical protein
MPRTEIPDLSQEIADRSGRAIDSSIVLDVLSWVVFSANARATARGLEQEARASGQRTKKRSHKKS